MFRQLDGYDSGARSQLASIGQSWTGSLEAESWTGSEAPYYQDVTASGMTSSRIPMVDVDLSGCADYAAETAMLTDFALLYRVTSGTDKVTVYANDLPSADIDLTIRAVK